MRDTHDDPIQIDINAALAELQDRTHSELANPVEIIDCDTFPDSLYSDARKWKRVEKVVAVVADLKGSTRLNFSKHANTSARLYEAVTGGLVRMVMPFEPDFVDIQGDGLFALFHGTRRFERAFCAAVSMKSFGELVLEPAIAQQFSDRFPDTGIKVGMAVGTLVAKNVGVHGTNEPVWAGKPVNWASKCAQVADKHQLIVTNGVWNQLKDNDYVVWSCGCPSGLPQPLWKAVRVEKLPEDEVECRVLNSEWCPKHGSEFCQAILDGDKDRDDVSEQAA
ncbi:MAG: hypothetical protein M3R21_08325 [Candidatus Dormibacteraeota bacterium]|nr:hypothetical protein [Candidatus Dormibacteraeota bacterium]